MWNNRNGQKTPGQNHNPKAVGSNPSSGMKYLQITSLDRLPIRGVFFAFRGFPARRSAQGFLSWTAAVLHSREAVAQRVRATRKAGGLKWPPESPNGATDTTAPGKPRLSSRDF